MESLIRLNPVAFSLVIPALISGCLAVYAFTRRPVVGSRAVGFLMLALYIWSFFYGVELSCLTLPGMMLSTIFEYLGITAAPVLVLILVLQYTGREKWVTPRAIVLLFVIPAITVCMVATNHLHYLYYTSVSLDTKGPFPMMALTWGPFFWIHTAYSYAMLLISILLLITRMGKPGSVFFNQSIAMLVGLFLPSMGNIIYVIFRWMPFGHLDMTPFAFAVTGVVIAWSMFRYGLFEIMPAAHDIIIDGLDDVVVVLDGQNRILEYNKAAQKFLGLSQKDIGLYATSVWKEWPGLVELVNNDREDRIEIVIHSQDMVSYNEAFAYKIAGLPEHALRKVISLHDISGMKQVEWALQHSEEKFRLLIENSHDIIYTMATDGVMTFVSPAWTALLGHPVNQVVGQSLIAFIHHDDVEAFVIALGEEIMAGQPVRDFEYRICHLDGSWRWHTTSVVPLKDEMGIIIGVEGISRDITERKQMEQKLEEMATHDFLTGLPNRVLLLDRFNIAAALANRNKTRIAVMSLDLDKFKSVNDTLGHAAGDQVLKVVATRLTGIMRASDTLARVGGDEFILMMMETARVEDATAVAQKFLCSFTVPLVIDGQALDLSTSIGIAIYPEDGRDLDTLIRKSDAAMYYSKGNGRNQFKFFGDGDVSD